MTAPTAPQQAGDGLTDEQLEDIYGWAGCTLDRFKREVRVLLAAPRQPGEMGAGVQTGWHDADAIIGRLMSSDPDFDDCADAASFIRRMYDEHMRGPDGYATWKDAAIAERTKRLAGRVDERVPYLPYLTDRADGVKGHYCITRWVPERKVVEHWNLRGHHWAAFSDDVLTMDQAIELLKRLEVPTKTAASAQQDEREALLSRIADLEKDRDNWRDYVESGRAADAILGATTQVQVDAGAVDDDFDSIRETLLDFIVNGFGATEDHDTIRKAIRGSSVVSLTDAEVEAVMQRIVRPGGGVTVKETK